MPVPAAPTVLDDFNTGASQLVTARAGWSSVAKISAGDISWQTDATPTKINSLNTNGTAHSNLWATQFGADQYAWFTYTGTPDDVYLYARCDTLSSSGAANGYALHTRWNGVGMGLQKNGSDLSVITRAAPLAGESYLLSVSGSTLEGWYRPVAGAWTMLVTTTDATITGAGYVGIQTAGGSVAEIDEFGGGEADPIVAGQAGLNFLRMGDRRS